MTRLIQPKWLAYQTYKFGTEDSRTFISNERLHEYVLLEGLASDLWKVISDTQDYNKIKEWAISKGLDKELDGFIDELKAQDLILNKTDDITNTQTDIQPVGCDSEEETLKLEEDMMKWCFKNGYLYSLFVELTYNCNLKCVHCYNPKNISNIYINLDKMKQIIDEARELGVFHITFSGGECTLNKDFIKIAEYARNKRMSVEIFTNGQILYDNPELLERIIKLYPYRVGISMYSLNEDIHEQITSAKGSHHKTLSVIKKLREKNINVQIKNFLLSINCKDCISVKRFADEIQANTSGDTSLTPTIEGDTKNFKYIVGEEDLYELYTNPNSPLNVKNAVKRDINKLLDEGLCSGGSFSLCVTPELEIRPCVSLPINLGNLNDTCLKDIWQSSLNKDLNSKLYQWQQVSFKDLKECYKEDYCAFCTYCAGMGMLENGYLKKSDVLCRQAKVKQKAYNDIHKNKKEEIGKV